MKKQKLVSCILALSLSTIISVPTFAANVTDTTLPSKTVGFAFSQAAETPLRSKTNTTSHYIKNTSGFNLWVQSKASDNTIHTVNNHAIVPTAQRLIRSNIYERGYRSCKLNITTATSGTTGTLKGVWSPDSVGSYPVAN